MMDNAFQVGICECPDINASSFAINKDGRYTLLAGRKGMLLVNLDGRPDSKTSQDLTYNDTSSQSNSKFSPEIVKRIPRNSKYDPTACHFNRHEADLFGLTTYQIVEIYSIDDLNPMKPKYILKGHSRTVADIEWSQFSQYILGSSGADCLTNLWDIRDSRRPSASLTTVAGATQVRFSKSSEFLLATSHEIDVRIWDTRNPNIPLYYIAAHSQKINGMDWVPNKMLYEQDQLITCSQDNTIKMWDIKENKVKPSANFSTKLPAWRIRYSPISSNAIITSTLPQLRSRNECLNMKIWSMKPIKFEQKKLDPIFALGGHTDVIVDFDIRNQTSSNDVEIVSWSKDKTIRIWRVDHQIIELSVDILDIEHDIRQIKLADDVADYLDHKLDSPTSIATTNVANISDHSVSSNKSPSTRPTSRQAKLSANSSPSQSNRLSKSPQSASTIMGTHDKTHDSKVSSNGSDIDDFGDELSNENVISTNELKQEFNLLNKNIPNLEFEELNSLRRICLVTARAKSVICRLRIALPPSYPHTDCPTFSIIDDSNRYGGDSLPEEAKKKLLGLLDETAQSQLSRGRNCLEPCLRKFVAELQQQTSQLPLGRYRFNESQQDYQKDDPITLSAQRDHSVPFPPTSGARFCGNLLVCFGRPVIGNSTTKPVLGEETSGANWLVETPRSMAQLSAQLDNMRRQGCYNLSTISISHFYYGAMKKTDYSNRNLNRNLYGSKYLSNRSRSILQAQSMSKIYKCAPVVVYDVSDLLGGISRDLAENYVFDKDVIRMCRRNANVAGQYNRKDLVQIWSLAELSSEGMLNSYVARKDQGGNKSFLLNHNSDFGDRPWKLHPFGSKLIQSLINHYVNNYHDVQTAAMLVWTFSAPKQTNQSRSNYDQFSSFRDANGPSTSRELHEDANDLSVMEEGIVPKFNILSPKQALQNDLIMHVYAELLYRLNLLNQRAMILKNIGASSSYHELFASSRSSVLEQNAQEQSILLNLSNMCYNPNCNTQCRSVQCTSCKKYTLSCSICRLPVRGTCSVCMRCLHGGHINHFDNWFAVNDYCPTGCGCRCLSIETK